MAVAELGSLLFEKVFSKLKQICQNKIGERYFGDAFSASTVLNKKITSNFFTYLKTYIRLQLKYLKSLEVFVEIPSDPNSFSFQVLKKMQNETFYNIPLVNCCVLDYGFKKETPENNLVFKN